VEEPQAGRLRVPTSAGKTLTGVIPIAPTPFGANGDLDLDGQRRVLDCMIDQGVDGICILANYSEQFLLADDERAILLDICLGHVAGRVPAVVTCSHFSTRIAAERGRRAAEAGAAMLMLMPPYHGTGLRADENGIVEHFARAARSGDARRALGARPCGRSAGAALGEIGGGNGTRGPRLKPSIPSSNLVAEEGLEPPTLGL
jgi:hypothetical protein